ncbi:hypothetical protein RIR_jg1572.t1 [Rhizophagus irregularis DAOM 181602=DAOM 197198]|nr:hypothetical protein RIR_jg2474.t1 [Rhizophagus irregularis DAOM 181602=DAOM 197198]GET59614.1 hypothetical protein RIR_jg1572.t1 [Rhizophagus irregularis DAOM 181602=DAOM 197198]
MVGYNVSTLFFPSSTIERSYGHLDCHYYVTIQQQRPHRLEFHQQMDTYNPTTSPTSEHAEAVTTMLTLMLTSAYVIHYDQTQETSSQQHRKTCYWSYFRP